jgi:hypothetical protein
MTQPVQPGRPADAAGYLKSRRGRLGYEASRAKAGYFGRLLTTLAQKACEHRWGHHDTERLFFYFFLTELTKLWRLHRLE